MVGLVGSTVRLHGAHGALRVRSPSRFEKVDQPHAVPYDRTGLLRDLTTVLYCTVALVLLMGKPALSVPRWGSKGYVKCGVHLE